MPVDILQPQYINVVQGFKGAFFIPPDRRHGLELGYLGGIDIWRLLVAGIFSHWINFDMAAKRRKSRKTKISVLVISMCYNAQKSRF